MKEGWDIMIRTHLSEQRFPPTERANITQQERMSDIIIPAD
jgi:hypothetical protein